MKISVIVTAFNVERYIVEALDSVLRQTRQPDEIIVIDDHSTDATPEILRRYSGRITYYRNELNQGALRTTLRGIRKSHGDVLAFLDGDDFWDNSKLAVVDSLFSEHEDLALLSHHHRRVDELGNDLGIFDDTHRNIKNLLAKQGDWKERSDAFRSTILLQQGFWLGSAYSIRRSALNYGVLEGIVLQYPEVQSTYLDLVIAPFIVLNRPELQVGYSDQTSFSYRVHSAGSMGGKDDLSGLLRSCHRGRCTNELIGEVIKQQGGGQAIFEHRCRLVLYYDFLCAVYVGDRRRALQLFQVLATSTWHWRATLKEASRMLFVGLFGLRAFLLATKLLHRIVRGIR